MLTNLGLVISLGVIQSAINLEVCKKSVHFQSDLGVCALHTEDRFFQDGNWCSLFFHYKKMVLA